MHHVGKQFMIFIWAKCLPESVYFKIFRDANSWGAMRQEMAIFKVGNSVCRVQFFSGAFILYSVRNEQLGAMRQKIAIFKDRNSVCRIHICFMIMMMMQVYRPFPFEIAHRSATIL
jgi:hypothetical protein